MSELAPPSARSRSSSIALAVSVPLLGRYLAHVYTSPKHLAVERVTYRVLRVDPDADQHWRSYAMSVLGFSLVGRPRCSSASAGCSSTCRSRPRLPGAAQPTAPGTPPSAS